MTWLTRSGPHNWVTIALDGVARYERFIMKKLIPLTVAAGLAAVLGAGVAEARGPQQVTFDVTITNQSVPGLLDTDRAMGTVPLSPPVYAVANGAGPTMFRDGQPASLGIEGVAEDGAVVELLTELDDLRRVDQAGAAFGPDGPLFAGQSTTFRITATPGDRLFVATMFVQSNDFFFADDGHGIRLFHGNQPTSGDVTSQIDLWDSGTEADTAPGTGPDQKPVMDGIDGPAEDSASTVVTLASETGDGFDLPSDEDVIKVTITPVG